MCASSRKALRKGVVIETLPLVRLGLARVFDTEGIDVAGEFDGSESGLLTKVRALAPDLLVMGAVGAQDKVAFTLQMHEWAKRKHLELDIVVLLDSGVVAEVTQLIECGVAALSWRSLGAQQLSQLLRDIKQGRRVIEPALVAMSAGTSTQGLTVGEGTDETALLTAKEVQVIQLLAQGKTNNELAAALFVTLPTIKSHLSHIYAKLGVNKRHDALAKALALGLLA